MTLADLERSKRHSILLEKLDIQCDGVTKTRAVLSQGCPRDAAVNFGIYIYIDEMLAKFMSNVNVKY